LSSYIELNCNGINYARIKKLNFKQNKMSINVKPLADRVIIEPSAAEETTAGGIIIPDTAKESLKKAKSLLRVTEK
jgi:hypothetical protein